MNSSMLAIVSLGAVVTWCALFRPQLALFLFALSLMALNDYLGGHPSSIGRLGNTLFYAADLFPIIAAIALIRALLKNELHWRVESAIFRIMVLTTALGALGIVLGLSNAFPSNDVLGGFRRYAYYPWAIFLPSLLLSDYKDVRWIEWAALAAATVICIIATYRIATWSTYWPEQHAEEHGYFRAMGYHDYLVVILAICLASGKLFVSRGPHSLPLKLSVAIFPCFVLASNYRFAWVLLPACVTLTLVLLRHRDSRRRSRMPILALVCGLILISVTLGRIADLKLYRIVQQRFEEQVLSSNTFERESYRLEMWKTLLHEWSRAPLLGLGFGKTFYYRTLSFNGEWYWAFSDSIHNTYLELLLKLGLVGLAWFIVAHVLLIRRCLSTFAGSATPFAAAGCVFVLAVLVQAGTQPLLTEPNGIVLCYLMMGSVLNCKRPDSFSACRTRQLVPLPRPHATVTQSISAGHNGGGGSPRVHEDIVRMNALVVE
jgi:hypothetical protein